MAKKISYHTVAVKYLKQSGVKPRSGNWKDLREALVHASGIPSPIGRGYKSGGIAILKKLGFKKPGSARSAPKAKDTGVNSKAFLNSYEWRKLRMQVLEKYGAACMCCGATREDGVQIHVDHIKPRRKYPELALDFDNLQVLCGACNHGKGNWSERDWRDPLTAAFKATIN